MRILGLADFHGDTALVERQAERAEKEKVDLVIICGDFTNFDQSTENLIGPFLKKNKKVLFVPGNHESLATADFLVDLYGIKNLNGYSVRYNDIGIFGCSGVNIGIHRLSEEEIFDLLKQGFERVRYLDKKIMVTHVHPTNSKIDKMTPFLPGSTSIRRAITELKPDVLLCSHVHEAEGIEEKIGNTRVINVGKEGKIIDL